MPPIDDVGFIRELCQRFPAIREEVDQDLDDVLVCVEMWTFRQFTEEAINAGNRDLVIRCYQFADRLLAEGDDAVRNAVAVAYLEHREFAADTKWAEDLLTTRLRTRRDAVLEYLRELLGPEESPPAKRKRKQSRDRGQSRRKGRSGR